MKILVVDDQAANRGLLAYLLEEDGHEVIEACDGHEGLDKFIKQVPDLILMDVMMPGMDGYQTAERIKAKADSHVPIIFLTALSDDISLSRCIESGGDDFLTKPVNETLLTAKIKAHERVRELNSELSNKNRELEALHSVIKQEYDLAEYVFESAISSHGDCENIKRFLSPMGGFSGDVILAARTNRDTMFIMLGDFTGHGLPAALGALPVTQAFEYLAKRGASLGDLASALNQTLYDYLPGHMFCAANLIELNAAGTKASCWMGGLPDMFQIDEKGLIRVVLRSNHLPLGVLSGRAFKREITEISFRPGESLITYSDGVTDCCDVDGEMLSEAGFEMMFDGKTPREEMFDHLVSGIRSFGEGRPQDDDISMLEVLAKPIPQLVGKKTRANQLPWKLMTELDLSQHRQHDQVASLLNLFANRARIRAHKDKIYRVVVAQYRHIIDQKFLTLDWGGLGILEEDDKRQSERGIALDKLTDARIFVQVNYSPDELVLRVCLSDREIPAKLTPAELSLATISGTDISFLGEADDGHCIITDIPFSSSPG